MVCRLFGREPVCKSTADIRSSSHGEVLDLQLAVIDGYCSRRIVQRERHSMWYVVGFLDFRAVSDIELLK